MTDTLKEEILHLHSYQEKREFFFHRLTDLIREKIDKADYDTSKPLSELLKQLDYSGLFMYMWKDLYSRTYVFDAEDQRLELEKTYITAKIVMDSQEILNKYIELHDEYCRNEFEKNRNDLLGQLSEQTEFIKTL